MYSDDKIDEIFVLEKFDNTMRKDKNIKIQRKWQELYMYLVVNLLVIAYCNSKISGIWIYQIESIT